MEAGKVLIVEDDADLRAALVEVLEAAGYRTAAVEKGAEALHLLRSTELFSLVLLDIWLPDMDGRNVASALAKIPGRERTRALAFTATTTVGPLPAPFVGCLTKPVDIQSLLKAVNEALTYRDHYPPPTC